MNLHGISNKEQSKRIRLLRWVTPIYLIVLFLLVHVAAPWRLSLLSTRHGWIDRRPGKWNVLSLILVVVGIISTIWTISLHYLSSPRTFLEMKQTPKLLARGPYAVSRNPMYLSELAFWLGWALFYGSAAVFIGFSLLLAMFNFVAVPYEERDLEKRFGEVYLQYKRTVPRWFGRNRH